ncbi:SUN domain-containing protein 2-like [Aphidius gifuensis]|uniref:SUN domain-containing protein 2-like n=1 Tax=Aphidius gifuensis TaxID=684658 RepID=UPI001CDC278C|nr:SUN domain-containing protein 2-like [Aphidius gifuensis]
MRGETGRAGKRPLRSLTAIEKISAIRRVHEGESKASVARDLSVPESTLRGWCKSEHKIRSMARNSSTPDSNEAHSPLSSSGIINNNNNLLINTSLHGNHSSEDEGQSSKRLKIDTSSSIHSTTSTTGYYTNENLENELTRLSDPSKIDYLSLMTSMAAMRPENNALLLQHLGLLGGNNVGPLAKSLLNLPAAMPHSSTVGLVENGLQYTKSNVNININNNHINNTNNNHHINSSSNNINNNNNNKRHSTSAITPTQSYTRKSSPPAAEIPLTPDPASPRKTSDLQTHHNHLQNNNIHSYNNNNNNNSMNYLYNSNNNSSISSQNYHQQNNQHRDVKKNNSSAQIPSLNNNKKIDEALWLWLSSQKGAANFNQQDGVYASWFWQWYKQGQGSTMPVDQQQQQQQSQQAQQSQQQLMNGKKSPSKTRALLDSVLCNNNSNNNNTNNNDSVKKLMNGVFDVFIDDSQVVNDAGIGAPQTAALPLTATSSSSSSVQSTTTTSTTTSVISSEEAIEHGEKFFKWLNKCSDPAVSRLQIIQLKYLLDNLKTGKKKPTHLKQRRK